MGIESQLTICCLASKTKLPLTSFKCAWFDENNYYEFFPLHVVKNRKAYNSTYVLHYTT